MRIFTFIVFLFCFSQLFSQVNLTNGLVAYYPFNGNANDESGNGNNPIFNNAKLTNDRNGNSNSAYHFNGVNQYMRIANNASINPSNQISLNVWVRPMGFYQGTCHGNAILMKGDGDFLTGNYLLRFDDYLYTNGANCSTPKVDVAHQLFYGNFSEVYTSYIQANKWCHVTYTYDGIVAKLYVNCELKSVKKVAGLTFTNAYDLFIGRLNSSQYPYWFNGDLDEVRIYNRALTQDEVTKLCTLEQPIASPTIDFEYHISKCREVKFNITKMENVKSFSWNLGDKTIGTKEELVHNYKKEGSYTVTLNAIGKDGKKINVVKKILLKTPQVDYSYKINATGKTVSFSPNSKGKLKYQWSFGDGTQSNKSNKITHTYTDTGQYSVSMIILDANGCTDTITKSIAIIDPAIVLPTVHNTNETTLPTLIMDTATGNISGLANRAKNLMNSIEVTHDSITVLLYDDAIEDGDSITLVYNNSVLVKNQILSSKGLEFRLKVNPSIAGNELMMYAENLGSIPPNTAMMVIYDGQKRYETRISSTLSSNGIVRFILVK